MNCREERIALFAGGDLPAVEAAEVERHVADCARCQVLLSGLRESLALLQEAHGDTVEPGHFAAVRARVMSQIRSSRRPWWREAWVYGLVAAAAMGLLVAVSPRPARTVAVAQPFSKPKPSSSSASKPHTGFGGAVTAGAGDGAAGHQLPGTGVETVAEEAKTPAEPLIGFGGGRLASAVTAGAGDGAADHQLLGSSVETVAKEAETPAEPLVVKLITNDPDVVIYWITESKGE
jgi:hypothetical protein